MLEMYVQFVRTITFWKKVRIPPQREGYSKYVKMTDLGTTKCMIRDDCFEDKKKYKIDRKT